MPFTAQVTAVLVFPVTLLVKFRVAPSWTAAAAGSTATAVGTAVTGTAIWLPTTVPVPGCRTANWMVPGCGAAPRAISLVAETKVVVTATSLASAWESAVKFAPLKLTS